MTSVESAPAPPVATPSVAAQAVTSPPSAPPLASAPVAAPASAEGVRPAVEPRRLELARLAAWSKPGLCSTTEEAAGARATLTARFHELDAAEDGKVLLDPRLPQNAGATVRTLLARARAEVGRQLGLQPAPPPVFVYLDQQLMKAAACINEDVVAFYDGALHLVLGRDDVQQSVTHEYTHHALFSSGLVGPAWAQEGIAMNLAGELWWRQRSRLQAALEAPFSADQMDSLIPYKLSADEAVAFYVQAALTVQCLTRQRGWSLRQLADSLRNGNSAASVSYELPELAGGSFLANCVAGR